MRVVVTGGSGFVGSRLCRYLLDAGHRVTALGSRPGHAGPKDPSFAYVAADTSRPGPWQEAVARADLVFNLAGRTIFKRWSETYKRQIHDSRILTTRHVAEAMVPRPGVALVSTSAVGYYGSCGDRELTEDTPPGDDFLAGVGRAWEAETGAAAEKGVRVAVARFGIPLDPGGGALAKMLPAYRFFAGGPLGRGSQWFPWIHLDDLVRALGFLADRGEMHGPYNLCAPHPVTNREMALALGAVLGRPARLAVPAMVLRLLMGEMAGLLLGSQRALPAKLLEAGFSFRYPFISHALNHLIHGRRAG
jgi:hypothetical protein